MGDIGVGGGIAELIVGICGCGDAGASREGRVGETTY